MPLYRSGSKSAKNWTPRLRDVATSSPGSVPGLSFFETLDAAVRDPGDKAQVVDLARLDPTLGVFPDDPAEGGVPGHVTICPIDATGFPDLTALEKWAAARDSPEVHPYTQMVLDAIVNQARREKI